MVTPIIILVLLSGPLAAGYLYSKLTGKPLPLGRYASWGLGLAFIFFFIGHFVKTEGMVEMLPAWLPFRLQLVYLTGVLELLIGIALFIPRYQVIASKIAIVVFVVFFPANIYAALNSVGLGGHQWGPVYMLIRGPLQIILIFWAYFLCVKSYHRILEFQAMSAGGTSRSAH